MKIKSLLLSLSLLALASCGSSRVAVDPNADVAVEVPCSGLEFMSNSEFFRSNAMGVSDNMQIASEKAMTAARLSLSAAVESTVKTVIDSYLSSYEENTTEESSSRFQALSRQVVEQKLNGVRVICNKTMKSVEGQFKCYVAIELSGADLVNELKAKVGDDSKLRTNFEYQKFQEIFEKEMSAQK